jgi:hypothetical protein
VTFVNEEYIHFACLYFPIKFDLQSQLEAQKGVSGFHDTQEELEKVSSVKSGVDEQKGKSLDEISDMVSRTMKLN